MAIDDNTLYGLTGAQIKDLAERVKSGGESGLIVYIDNTIYTVNQRVNMFKDSELTVPLTAGELYEAVDAGNTVLFCSNGIWYTFVSAVENPGDYEWPMWVSSGNYIYSLMIDGLDWTYFYTSARYDAHNYQADWNITNPAAGSYIKNKPTIPTVPTTVSSFTNDADYQNASQVASAIAAVNVPEEFTYAEWNTLWA